MQVHNTLPPWRRPIEDYVLPELALLGILLGTIVALLLLMTLSHLS